MPTIAIFYGIQILMFFMDDKKHSEPHIHARFQGKEASFSIITGEILSGEFDNKRRKMVEVWIDLHRDDLMIDWELAIIGQELFKIEPLR